MHIDIACGKKHCKVASVDAFIFWHIKKHAWRDERRREKWKVQYDEVK